VHKVQQEQMSVLVGIGVKEFKNDPIVASSRRGVSTIEVYKGQEHGV